MSSLPAYFIDFALFFVGFFVNSHPWRLHEVAYKLEKISQNGGWYIFSRRNRAKKFHGISGGGAVSGVIEKDSICVLWNILWNTFIETSKKLFIATELVSTCCTMTLDVAGAIEIIKLLSEWLMFEFEVMLLCFAFGWFYFAKITGAFFSTWWLKIEEID